MQHSNQEAIAGLSERSLQVKGFPAAARHHSLSYLLTPQYTTPHSTAHYTTPHHTTPHHATSHNTPQPITPQHITPHHATAQSNVKQDSLSNGKSASEYVLKSRLGHKPYFWLAFVPQTVDVNFCINTLI